MGRGNIGPPFLEAGSRVLAPIREMAPLTPRAAEAIDTYDTYPGPAAGFAEQVYCYDLLADGAGKNEAAIFLGYTVPSKGNPNGQNMIATGTLNFANAPAIANPTIRERLSRAPKRTADERGIRGEIDLKRDCT